MPFDDRTRAAAFELVLSGQLRIHEAAELAGVSLQGVYLHLPKGFDWDKQRAKFIRQLWADTLKELE